MSSDYDDYYDDYCDYYDVQGDFDDWYAETFFAELARLMIERARAREADAELDDGDKS